MDPRIDKKTKIVCTIGPISKDATIMKGLIQNGANVFRINGAFEDIEGLRKFEELVRSVSTEIALMLDIKGHEVRLNLFSTPLIMKPGDIIEIGSKPEHGIYPVSYPDLYKDLSIGTRVLFDDGIVDSTVTDITADGIIKLKIITGTEIKPGKSLNIPNVLLSNAAITEKDKAQIDFCKTRGWSFVAASYIRNKEDALLVKKAIGDHPMRVIAKIEDIQGVNNLDEILDVVDGVMVARGDLGVEVAFEKLPMIQKEMIWKCNLRGKVVITATQMLDSMINNPRPTRAEVSDVANAIIDGSDAVMLSGESASGKYPVEAVTTMFKIAKEVEPFLKPQLIFTETAADVSTDALTKAAFQIAFDMEDKLKAIVVVTNTGGTAHLLGRYNLPQPIYAFVREEKYRLRLTMSKGINACYPFTEDYKDRDSAINAVIEEIKNKELASSGDSVLIIGNAYVTSTHFPNLFEIVKI